nr:MAG TPA: hypothetical protein [Caudoviricetes sp.]
MPCRRSRGGRSRCRAGSRPSRTPWRPAARRSRWLTERALPRPPGTGSPPPPTPSPCGSGR